ncbi:hypothetical protein GH733_001607 [Mirounga leonina]|nr:hypothetical protein GH733_001607 [Mirounga leonina]
MMSPSNLERIPSHPAYGKLILNFNKTTPLYSSYFLAKLKSFEENCSSFLIKRNKQTHSTEPNNLKACNSCHDGLIHCKTVGKELAVYGKCVLMIQPANLATSYMWATISKNAQAILSSIWHMICKNKYSPDLCMAAICRASTILFSQKPVMGKRMWFLIRVTPGSCLIASILCRFSLHGVKKKSLDQGTIYSFQRFGPDIFGSDHRHLRSRHHTLDTTLTTTTTNITVNATVTITSTTTVTSFTTGSAIVNTATTTPTTPPPTPKLSSAPQLSSAHGHYHRPCYPHDRQEPAAAAPSTSSHALHLAHTNSSNTT